MRTPAYGTEGPGLTRSLLWIGCALLLSTGLSGCMLKNRVLAQRSVMIAPIEVVAERDLTAARGSRLGVLVFSGPGHVGQSNEMFARIYFEKLLEGGPFRETLLVHQEPKGVKDALLIGIQAQCDAVLVGDIDTLVDSSGATPTALEMNLRVLQTETGILLAYYRQRAQSLPGTDVDLYWRVITGDPAVRTRGLAELLAEQAAQQLSASAWRLSQ